MAEWHGDCLGETRFSSADYGYDAVCRVVIQGY